MMTNTYVYIIMASSSTEATPQSPDALCPNLSRCRCGGNRYLFSLGLLGRLFAQFYDRMYGTSVFSKLATQAPTRLALLDYRCHPFFGAHCEFRLCQPRRVPSHKWLTDYLKEHGVTHIVVRSKELPIPGGWDAYVGLGEWVAGQRRDFTLIRQDPVFSLYRVGPESAEVTPAGAIRSSLARFTHELRTVHCG